MNTEQLIRAMAADTRRPPPVAMLLAGAVLAGAALVAVLFLPMLGTREDLGAALARLPVLVKQAYPVLLAVAASGAALRLARPGLPVGGWAMALAAVPIVLALAVAVELMLLPAADWGRALIGHSIGVCLPSIAAMSLPLLAGSLWALRYGASTRPALSGALAGLISGGAATAVYAFSCTEDSPLFYAVWYMLAILTVTALGALLGARLLRW